MNNSKGHENMQPVDYILYKNDNSIILKIQ